MSKVQKHHIKPDIPSIPRGLGIRIAHLKHRVFVKCANLNPVISNLVIRSNRIVYNPCIATAVKQLYRRFGPACMNRAYTLNCAFDLIFREDIRLGWTCKTRSPILHDRMTRNDNPRPAKSLLFKIVPRRRSNNSVLYHEPVNANGAQQMIVSHLTSIIEGRHKDALPAKLKL